LIYCKQIPNIGSPGEAAALAEASRTGKVAVTKQSQTNPFKANAKPRFPLKNAEIVVWARTPGDETNPLVRCFPEGGF
jgi:hypothetical protein